VAGRLLKSARALPFTLTHRSKGRAVTAEFEAEQYRRDREAWLDRVDAALSAAEQLVGAARAADASLAARISLWIEIAAVRQQVADERTRMISAREQPR